MVLAMKNRVDTRFHKAMESVEQYVSNVEREVRARKAVLVQRLTDITDVRYSPLELEYKLIRIYVLTMPRRFNF